MAFVSTFSSATCQPAETDSITFSRSHAEFLAMAMIERDHFKQKIAEMDSSLFKMRRAIDAREITIRKCEEQRDYEARIRGIAERATDACHTQVEAWKVQAKKNKRTGVFVGAGGVLLGLVIVVVSR